MRITALAGGIGAARFLRGLLHHLAVEPAGGTPADVTVIGNTGDDITLHGLRICPDLDTVMYTLGGGVCETEGWGRNDETHTVAAELRAHGTTEDWFSLGDRDIATHLVRTSLLARGTGLAEVTAHLCERWRPGVRLLPMTEDRVETHVLVDRETLRAARRRADDAARNERGPDGTASPAGPVSNDQLSGPGSSRVPDRGTQDRKLSDPRPHDPGRTGNNPRTIPGSTDDHNETIGNVTAQSVESGRTTPPRGTNRAPLAGSPEDSARYEKIHFQEWWVRLRAGVPAHEIVAVGAEESRPAPGVLEAIASADVVLLPPSNPVVSLGTILSVPGIRRALREGAAPVVGVCPIIGGAPVRGMADACLAARGLPTSAATVAGLYADFLDGWLVDDVDAPPRTGPDPTADGTRTAGPGRPPRPLVRALPLLMSDLPSAARIAGEALHLAADLRTREKTPQHGAGTGSVGR
ncbi:MAG: 2-phospho-L-lactate transferase [Actinomycetota bacterium]|nr:2-phospho-L-lactate transferase [Actinomycetota bacterium]